MIAIVLVVLAIAACVALPLATLEWATRPRPQRVSMTPPNPDAQVMDAAVRKHITGRSGVVMLTGITAEDLGGSDMAPLAVSYLKRHGVRSRTFRTMTRPDQTAWILFMLGDSIRDRVVVEIGAGDGTLAIEMAKIARHVYAIEAFPPWAERFSARAFEKPKNLTYILGCAEDLVGSLKADVAIVVTGSDESYLRALAERFAPQVCCPWQDWNDGKAVIRS